MKHSAVTQPYNFIIRMIEQSNFNAHGIPRKFFEEDPQSTRSLFYWIKKICDEESKGTMAVDYRSAFRILADAVSKYLLKYPATASARQVLYQHLFAWCESLGDQFHISNYDMILSDIPLPVERDLTIALAKELHARDGISKNDLAEKYGVSEKTIQVSLRQLSGEGRYQPLRLGGQAVTVPVAYKEEKHRDDKRRFYTPNSMSPIIFQMNLMQVATLMQSFQMNYDSGNNIPLDLAVDTWSQLSDYVKDRIREIFCQRDQSFSEFLDIVESEVNSDDYRFMTESEMMDLKDISVSERLDLAYKGGMVCNLSLIAPHRTKKNQRIIYDHDCHKFYAVPADDLSADRLYFSLDEVYMISEV